MEKIKELLKEVKEGTVSQAEYQRRYNEIHDAARRGDLSCIDDLLAYRREGIEKGRKENDEFLYILSLESASMLAERGANQTWSLSQRDTAARYADESVADAVEAADWYWEKNNFDEASKRYPNAVRLLDDYRRRFPTGKYAQNDFLFDFYARVAFAAQYHAQELAAAEANTADFENHDLLLKRLQQSKAAFEMIPNRHPNDTFYYAQTQRMLVQYGNSTYAAGYFNTLCALEKQVSGLDADLHGDFYRMLGEAYEVGCGVSPNAKKASAYYRTADKASHQNASQGMSSTGKEKKPIAVKGEYALRSKGSLLFELIVYGVLLIGGILLPFIMGSFNSAPVSGTTAFAQGSSNFFAALLIGLIIAGIPAGWRTLTKITPQVFLFLPIGGWVLYFLLKGLLSMFIGWTTLPFRVVKCIRALRA